MTSSDDGARRSVSIYGSDRCTGCCTLSFIVDILLIFILRLLLGWWLLLSWCRRWRCLRKHFGEPSRLS
jgi:hypothetical protein